MSEDWYADTSLHPDNIYLPWPEPDDFEVFVLRLWRRQVERHAVSEGITA